MGFRLWGLGFRVWGLGLRVWGDVGVADSWAFSQNRRSFST